MRPFDSQALCVDAIIRHATWDTVFKHTGDDNGVTAAHLAATQNLWEVLETMVRTLGRDAVP